jgi:hypothetical protein
MSGSWDSLTDSIGEVARRTGESQWTVKDKLRRGVYLGKKSGRRTLVIVDSVKKHINELPDAVFAPVR